MQTSHIGTSDVIFAYNGRDGVITDYNGLAYMRARYYSPAMRRFINADIIHGTISDSTSLNRYSFVNGNPVSFVDPFGLSAERGALFLDFEEAVLVTKFEDGGLPVFGHTVLYFKSTNGLWFSTEFNTEFSGKGLKNKKSEAIIYWDYDPDVSVFYDNGYINNPEGLNYVVLKGDFNKCVELAIQYAENLKDKNTKDFGRYNFLFHNCSDYTNMLLDAADIDGMYSQILGDSNALISIPILRELELSMAYWADFRTKLGIYPLTKFSEILGEDTMVGGTFASVATFINDSTNYVGDVIDGVAHKVGGFFDGAKQIGSDVTNTIVDGYTAIKNGVVWAWNKIFG